MMRDVIYTLRQKRTYFEDNLSMLVLFKANWMYGERHRYCRGVNGCRFFLAAVRFQQYDIKTNISEGFRLTVDPQAEKDFKHIFTPRF